MSQAPDTKPEPRSLWDRIAWFCIEYRWLLLAFAAVIGVGSFFLSRGLKSQRQLESMFAKDDVRRIDFEFLKETFGGNDIVLAVLDVPDLWNADGSGLKKLENVSGRIEKEPGVQSVMDLSKLNTLIGSLNPNPFQKAAPYPLLDPKNDLAQAMLKLFEGYTHKPGSTTTAIACLLHPASGSNDKYVKDLDSLSRLAVSLDASLIGEPVMVHEGFRLVEADGRRLGIMSSVVLALLILIGFRSIRWTLIAVAVVQWSILVTQGCLVLIGMEVTMVSSMLTSIVTVIGVATSIHWMLGYQKSYAKAIGSKQQAVDGMQGSLRGLIRPIVWACVTDAVGFGSLLFADVGPVRDYGLMMAIASGVVLIGILAIVPGLATIGNRPKNLQMIPGDMLVRWWLAKSLKWVVDRKWIVASVSVVLLVVAFIGSLRIQVETDFIKNFSRRWPMVRAYEKVETELGGAGVWDIVLPAPAELSNDYVAQVVALEDRLRSIAVGKDGSYRLTKVMSVVDADAAASSSSLAKLLPSAARIAMMEKAMPDFFHSMMSQSEPSDNASNKQHYLRILLRSPEQSPADAKLALIDQVRKEVQSTTSSPEWKKNFNNDSGEARVTGHFVLLATMVDSLIAGQWKCFGIALLGICLAVWLAVRDVRWMLAALIPNVLPALAVLGVFGLLRWPVNLGVALIAAVSLGLSVDSSLHYLIRLKSELAAGKKLRDGLKTCQSDVGMAMLVSTTALILGFGWLAMSDFYPTVFFGTTAALTMLGGLIGNLWLLPVMLTILERKK